MCHITSHYIICLSVPSRCVPAVTTPQRQRQRWWPINQTWKSGTWRRGTLASSEWPERNPQTPVSFPATLHLLAPAQQHNKEDNKMLTTLGITSLVCWTVKDQLHLVTAGIFAQNSSLPSYDLRVCWWEMSVKWWKLLDDKWHFISCTICLMSGNAVLCEDWWFQCSTWQYTFPAGGGEEPSKGVSIYFHGPSSTADQHVVRTSGAKLLLLLTHEAQVHFVRCTGKFSMDQTLVHLFIQNRENKLTDVQRQTCNVAQRGKSLHD